MTSFTKTDQNSFDIVGNLAIKGLTKQIILRAEFNGFSKNMDGKRVVSFSAKTTISRADYNLGWNVPLESGGLILGENVDLDLEIELIEA